MVAAQAAMEARLMLRNGEQLLLAVVIPVIVLVGGVNGAHHVGIHFSHPAVDVFTPGVLALAIMSTSFTSLAIATGFERRYGVIKRLGASPLPRSGLLAGKVGALLLVEVMQVIVIGADPDGAYLWPAGNPVRYKPRSGGDLKTCIARAARLGLETLVLDQTRADVGLRVVKVIVPGMRHFWARFAEGRLYCTATPEAGMNPAHLVI